MSTLNPQQSNYHEGLEVSPRHGDAHAAKYVVENTSEETQPKYLTPPEPTTTTHAHSSRRGPLAWPYLILYALLIAIISAVIGGLVSKAIVQKDNPSSPAERNNNTCVPETNSNNNTNTNTNPAIQSDQQKYCSSIPNVSRLTTENNNKIFFAQCSTDWFGDDIAMFWAPNMTTCIEACFSVNMRIPREPCAGAGWQSHLVTIKEAKAADSSGPPVNCWLKSGLGGRTVRGPGSPTTVMSLCVKEGCEAQA